LTDKPIGGTIEGPERAALTVPLPADTPDKEVQPLAAADRTGKSPAFQFSENFWRHVNKTESCWLWTGGRDKDGYGVFHAGRSVRAHRFSFEHAYGWLPSGGVVMHKCDTPQCVRPDHLVAGTHADNVADKIAKGRLRVPAGAEHWRRRLSMDQVTRAREMWASGAYTQVEIAKHFAVSGPTIHRAIRKVMWEERNV
jgi:hypothetical protein